MLYSIFIGALAAEYEVEARNHDSSDSIGRYDIIKALRDRHHRLSGSRKMGSMLAMLAMPCSPAAAMVATEEGQAAVTTGMMEAAVN